MKHGILTKTLTDRTTDHPQPLQALEGRVLNVGMEIVAEGQDADEINPPMPSRASEFGSPDASQAASQAESVPMEGMALVDLDATDEQPRATQAQVPSRPASPVIVVRASLWLVGIETEASFIV